MKTWKDKLKLCGLKSTPQRLLILKTLAATEKFHPDVEELFSLINQKALNISKATIYRNLKLLSNVGLVTELYFRDGKVRFELNEDHHHHFVCLACGKIEIIHTQPFNDVLASFSSNHKVISHQFDIFGYCENCCLTN